MDEQGFEGMRALDPKPVVPEAITRLIDAVVESAYEDGTRRRIRQPAAYFALEQAIAAELKRRDDWINHERTFLRARLDEVAAKLNDADAALDNSARLFVNKNAEFLAAMRFVDDMTFAMGASQERTTKRIWQQRFATLQDDLAKIRSPR